MGHIFYKMYHFNQKINGLLLHLWSYLRYYGGYMLPSDVGPRMTNDFTIKEQPFDCPFILSGYDRMIITRFRYG